MDDSFDLEEFENLTSQPTVTAWNSQVAPKTRVRRTYSRRGSTSVLSGSVQSITKSELFEEPLNFENPGSEQEISKDDDVLGDRSIPTFKPDAPKIPGRRRFTRANSIATTHPHPQCTGPPLLRRAASVSSSVEISSNASLRSSSLSSSIDSFAELCGENSHPNLDPLEEQASPKRSARLRDMRGRKKVRSVRNLSTLDNTLGTLLRPSHSFSNLAREDGSSWIKPGTTISDGVSFSAVPPPPNDLDFLESPAMSSVGSSRKRGICESPFDDYDECLSAGGFSATRQSTSRSRILSPPRGRIAEFSLESVEKANNALMESSKKGFHKDAKIEVSDVESGPETTPGIDSSDDISVEEVGHRRSPVPVFVPYEQKQKKRLSMADFPDTSTSAMTLQAETAEVDDVLKTMSSSQDLKFLCKTLNRECEGSRVSWHVALPVSWEAARKAEFIQWTTRSLGFTLRAAGGQVTFLQISKSRGVALKKLLEDSMGACIARGIGRNSPSEAERRSKPKHFTFCTTPRLTTNLVDLNGFVETPKDCYSPVDNDLLNGMMALGMNESKRLKQDFPVKSAIILEDDDDISLQDSRPSLENHSSSQDLMAHMHGVTPVPKRGKPSRLSLQSLGSVASSGMASKYSAASPFPQGPLSSIGKSSNTNCFVPEVLETPMMKPQDLGWGSCPVDGRDWGSSTQCDPNILEDMLRRLEQMRSEAGFCDSPCEAEMEALGPRQTALGLDLEAASDYREPAASPESISNNETCSDDVVDGVSESSPWSGFCVDRIESVNEVQASRNDFVAIQSRAIRRRQTSFAKHKRMSLFASALNPAASIFNNRKSLFVRPTRTSVIFGSSIIENELASEHTFGTTISAVQEPDTCCLDDDTLLKQIFIYLTEPELLRTTSLVCTKWADASTEAHAELMLMSVGCKAFLSGNEEESDDEDSCCDEEGSPGLLERPWHYITSTFPWARFLAEGGFKQVYKVFNHTHRVEEAISVMDINMLKDTGEMNVVGAELAVSVMLSSLVRRGICPNFVATRGVFSSIYKPPASLWGSEKNKCPKGNAYVSPKAQRKPKAPKKQGRYQYIRMELCDGGDAEEYLKTLPDELMCPDQARQMLFQMAFSLHAAASRCSLKHYDVKLLNYFIKTIQSEKSGDVVLRYGLGDYVFALRSAGQSALMAKLADYGTSNVDSASNGQQVTIAQFTTLENTPTDFMILGDQACQGHGHDHFGLGLCMLHLYTGHAPYEEILEEVVCPGHLKRRLRDIWECEDESEYSIIRSVILSDVDKDEEGHIIEGEPNEVLYDTFYRFLVLFGLPELSPALSNSKVWSAVRECLEGMQTGKGRTNGRKKRKNDISRYTRDCRKYSLSHGNNKYIARARDSLEAIEGGIDLLRGLVSFDPNQRLTALDAMNSPFMAPLREATGEMEQYSEEDDVRTYTSFSTHY